MLIPEQSHNDFFEIYVFITVDLFSIVVSNKSAIHFAYFELEGILYKSSPYEVKVFSLKTLIISSKFIYRIVFIKLPILNVITNRTRGSCFNLKHIRITILVDISSISLRTKQNVVVYYTISMIVVKFFLNNSSLKYFF